MTGLREYWSLVTKHRLRLVLSALLGLVAVMGVATIQFTVVYGAFRPSFLFVPGFVGLVLGFSIGLVTLLVKHREGQLRRRIEEKNQLLERLELSEQRFNQLAENINEAFWITSPDWRQVHYISPAFDKIWGKPGEELYEDGMMWISSVHPDDSDLVKAEVSARSGNAGFDPAWPEYRIITPEGEIKWILVRSYPIIESDGTLSAVAGIAEDITDRHQAGEELVHAKVIAEKASTAKTSFLANMSHELRTPLNSIIGFSQALSDETFGPLGGQKNKEYVEIINSAGGHLLHIIGDILDLTKIEAGEDKLFEENVDVSAEIRLSLDMMSEQANRKNITLREQPPFEEVVLWGDEVRLRQIILNLLSNAIKFTPEDGEVSVSAWRDKAGASMIRVSDTGIGIDTDDLEKVISPFEQVEDVFVRQEGGTGLGLSLVRSLMEMHGGIMSIESTLGVGTTVTLHFPARRAVHSGQD